MAGHFKAPDLPNSFPCWVKATYSWGGENYGDLGFVEGDLIECVNAGDGSWWSGRLRRDPRTVGMFPSNFIEVLPEDFTPSNLPPSRSASPNPQATEKPKTKPFRKPFQAYAAPDSGLQSRSERRKQETRTPSPSPKPRNERIKKQAPKGYNAPRAHSPLPSYLTRQPAYTKPIRADSPSDDGEYGSPPPPPPPPHRNDFRAQTSTGFHEHRNEFSSGFHRPRSLTPDPPTPERAGHTPSPLTHAMNDVISSLEDMGTEQVPDPWLPEVYERRSGYQPAQRPQTSIGIDHEYEHSKNRPNHKRSRTDFSDEPTQLRPQLSNYVERMESRLGRTREKEALRISEPESEIPPEVPPKGSFFRPKSPFGRPKSPFGRPKSPFGRPKSPFSRPKSPFSRPKSPFGSWGRPKSPFGRPKSPFGSFGRPKSPFGRPKSPFASSDSPPPLPPINPPRAKSSMGNHDAPPVLRHRKSAYEVGKNFLSRNFTGKSTSTNTSNNTTSTSTNNTTSTNTTTTTNKSLMSGQSAGAYSATSAGEYARKQAAKYGRAQSAMGVRKDDFDGSRPETPFTGVTYHSSHASTPPPRSQSQAGWRGDAPESSLGSATPKAKKSGFFKRMVESAKTGAASARSTISVGSPVKPQNPPGVHGFGNFGTQYKTQHDAAKDGGLGTDWVRVRQDVNRSNSLSRYECLERKQRCQILGLATIDPISELRDILRGDEGGDGQPVLEPTDFQTPALLLVDKNARFITTLPVMSNAMSLTIGFVCRPYKTDLQRLRAIFTWCAEKVAWEEEYEGNDVDTDRVVQQRRGATEEIVFLVMEMCQAVNISCNVIRGYLKTPGEIIPEGRIPHPNHFWNSVLIDNEWRIMDCSLASPSHPKRSLYSNVSHEKAEGWYFLTRPSEICYTHVPVHHEDQHLVPRILPDILLALPCVCPPYFKNGLEIVDYNTSLLHIHDLEMVHIKLNVPANIECCAEVEALSLGDDVDGDHFDSGDVRRMPALAQAAWIGEVKQYKVKAILPQRTVAEGVLKVYAGSRGLMNGSKINPHPMVFALPIIHTGDAPKYDFLGRYPTPRATRHDLYVMQPQCKYLVVGNTFVFAVRQHASYVGPEEEVPNEAASAASGSRDGGRSPIPAVGFRDGNRSPLPLIRPASALSLSSSSAGGNDYTQGFINHFSEGVKNAHTRYAKLAIQAPGGKILRFTKKEDRMGSAGGTPRADGTVDVGPDGRVFETIIKCGERGIWRGLVLADKSAKWCVFAEWICV